MLSNQIDKLFKVYSTKATTWHSTTLEEVLKEFKTMWSSPGSVRLLRLLLLRLLWLLLSLLLTSSRHATSEILVIVHWVFVRIKARHVLRHVCKVFIIKHRCELVGSEEVVEDSLDLGLLSCSTSRLRLRLWLWPGLWYLIILPFKIIILLVVKDLWKRGLIAKEVIHKRSSRHKGISRSLWSWISLLLWWPPWLLWWPPWLLLVLYLRPALHLLNWSTRWITYSIGVPHVFSSLYVRWSKDTLVLSRPSESIAGGILVSEILSHVLDLWWLET